MKNNDKTQGRVAARLGIAASTMHDILRNRYLPSLKLAYEIELYTNGAITIYDWLDQGTEQNNKLNKSKIQTKEKAVKK